MSTGGFVLRPAAPRDLDAIVALAVHLDTINLSPDPAVVEEAIAGSVQSFCGDTHHFDPERRFWFVLADAEDRVWGTSMVHAQHGTYDAPHVFFNVDEQERYSRVQVDGESRQLHMVHRTLRLGMTYKGPTEIGGLVLHPDLRGHPGRLGRLLSLGRFAFIAAHRSWFRDRVLAELLPPLVRTPGASPTSALWDALGSRFTDLTYAEADHLSRSDKEFIWRLFPQTPVHVSLLHRDVQAIVGRVGDGAMGAMKLLTRIGFTDSGPAIDPFDGGPHYEADTDKITVVADAAEYEVVGGEVGSDTPSALISFSADGDPNRWRCVWAKSEPVAESFDEHGRLRRLRMPQPELARLAGLDPVPERIAASIRPERRTRAIPRRTSGG